MRALAPVIVVALSCSPSLKPIDKIPVKNRQAVTSTVIPARITWLIDKSGSMLTNTTTAPPCPSTIGACGPGSICPGGCETRIELLQAAIDSTQLDAGVHNLVAFPASVSQSCSPAEPSTTASNLSFADLQNNVLGLQPGGGTPTAASMLFVSTFLSSLDAGAGSQLPGNDLVLLFTDGAPNCNADNPNNCTAGGCQCTTGTCTLMSGLCSLGCLDDLATVNAANTLFSANIDLMILPIGFNGGSADDQTLASNVFGQMKSTVQRDCATSADCGDGGTCNSSGFCSGQWKFSSLAEFAPAAERIRQELKIRGRCFWSLASSETADHIEVDLNGAALPAAQWELRTPTTLHIKGDACTQLVNDSSLSPSVTEM